VGFHFQGLISEDTILRELTFRSESGFFGSSRRDFVAQKFLPEDRHIAWGFDAQANFAAIDIDNGDADVVVDVNLLTQFSAEY
jgi:hypothetical protein